MWWVIPLLGLVLGVLAGQYAGIEIPAEMVKYLSIAILAALDSVFGGVRSLLEKTFNSVTMLSGFFANALLAALLAYMGDRLGIDLYYAAVFAFGVRLFDNLAKIRHFIIAYFRRNKTVYVDSKAANYAANTTAAEAVANLSTNSESLANVTVNTAAAAATNALSATNTDANAAVNATANADANADNLINAATNSGNQTNAAANSSNITKEAANEDTK
jgi:small basic protein